MLSEKMAMLGETRSVIREIFEYGKVRRAEIGGENIFDFKPGKTIFGIVLGNEGSGVSKQLQELCSRTVSIPMKNSLESLNVAVAASLFMYILGNRD